jgi:hypothetical protein
MAPCAAEKGEEIPSGRFVKAERNRQPFPQSEQSLLLQQGWQ